MVMKLSHGTLNRPRAIIGTVGPALDADAAASDVARPVAVGTVLRPRLFERLGTARASVVSAAPGSGKTVLLRSWIGQSGGQEEDAGKIPPPARSQPGQSARRYRHRSCWSGTVD